MDSSDRREPKRARQACLNCRRKKARCSGEKPVCAFCARLKQACEWDTASNETASKSTPAIRRASGFTQDSALAARVALLEAKLSLLNDGSTLSASTNPTTTTSPSGSQTQKPRKRRGLQTDADVGDGDVSARNFSSLPSKAIFNHLIDAYFEYNHCQPYSYFHGMSTLTGLVDLIHMSLKDAQARNRDKRQCSQWNRGYCYLHYVALRAPHTHQACRRLTQAHTETTFRQNFEDDVLPEYLKFAFAATACRFCEHEFFFGRQLEAMSAYANASWHQ